jgi:4-hydroxy-tetrahydrodipicolinate synthase
MHDTIAGVIPVLQTPFGADGEIDDAALQREIDWAYDVGADGICLAMVSEVLRLTRAERIQLTQKLVELSRGRGVVVASVGAESTIEALQFARAAADAGCHAIMAIPPISTALGDEPLWGYFSQLADAVELPLIVQDASSYVGRALSLDLCVRLLNAYGERKILFKPEASPVGPNLSALRDRTGGRARIFDGSGGILLIDAYRRGIVGTMPAVDLLDGIVTLWRALRSGDEQLAYRVFFPICALVALQLQAGLDGFLAIEKYILVRRGIFTSAARRPPYQWELDAETQQEVDRLLDHLAMALASG